MGKVNVLLKSPNIKSRKEIQVASKKNSSINNIQKGFEII